MSPRLTVEFYGLPISTIKPLCNYSPWQIDCEFQKAFNEARSDTAVDEYRHYELWQLALQMKKVKGDFLEVGVWTGGTDVILATAAALVDSARIVHLCDTFEGIAKAGPFDPFYQGGEFADTSLEAVRARMIRLGLSNIRLHRGVFPDEGAASLRSSRLCLVHIDVDVYESARQSFEWAWPRLAVGGAVVFDDFGWVDCAGVIKFVNEEVYSQRDALVLHNLNGHAVVVKTAARKRTPHLGFIRKRPLLGGR